MNGFLGADVSKGYADFILLSQDFSLLESSLQFDDTPKGHAQLQSWLKKSSLKHNLDHIYVGLESTGGFEDNWYAMFCQHSDQVSVSRLNPRFVQQADISLQGTDTQSARKIAHYLIRYSDKIDYEHTDQRYRSFRKISNHIRLMLKQNTQMLNELKQVLYSCYPQLQRHCHQGIPNWVLLLLMKYPTPQKLARAKVSSIAKIPSITEDKAKELKQQAINSVGVMSSESDAFLISHAASQLMDKKEQIKTFKKHLEQQCVGPEVELLQSIPGIGAYSASCIMIQIESINRFASPKKLAGYFGVYPELRESGDLKKVSRMSKAGRPSIRSTLYMCANSAVIHNAHFKNIYHRHRSKGKSHKQALGVIMHKLLRIVWAVLTYKEPFCVEVDQTNQQKSTQTTQENTNAEITRKRRLQSFDQQAPISRRTHKKRKAYQLSQVSDAEQMRDLTDTPIT